MKRVLWMALLTLALPVAAFAGSVDFSAQNSGTLSGSSAGLTLSAEGVNSITGLTPTTLQSTSSNLAVISFTTGALTQTSSNTWTFASGGSFTITAENIPGIANGTVLFQGTFNCGSGNVCTFSESGATNGSHIYVFNGSITGTWYNGSSASGFNYESTINTGLGIFDGSSIPVMSADTQVTTPEPGSLMLMGTGLVGLGGVLRRKLKA